MSTKLCLLASLIVLVCYICGVRPYIVMSGSMEPSIRTGSLCLVDTKAEYDEIEVSDVIAFRQGAGMVTHRVIAITEDGMETKGDANECSDGITTTRVNFGGKTVVSIPYAGYVFHVMQQRWMRWGLAMGALVWIIGKTVKDPTEMEKC